MIVLVDMDDTIEQLLPAWLDWLNDRYGVLVTPDDIHSWNMDEAYPMLTKEQVYEPLFHDEFWDNVKPMDGAAEYLERIINDGHEVYIVTASNPHTLKAKMDKVLFRYFPFIHWDHVIVTSKKQLIYGDVRIDDGPHNLTGANGLNILVDAPHNRSFDEKSHNMRRARSWKEICNLVWQYDAWLNMLESME